MALEWVQNACGDSGTSTTIRYVPAHRFESLVLGLTETGQLNSGSPVYKMKFILRIYLGTTTGGTLVATIKQSKNNYESAPLTNYRAFFDIKEIVSTYLDFTTENPNIPIANQLTADRAQSIHELGTESTTSKAKPFAVNNDIVTPITVEGSYEFSTQATGTPIEYTGTKPTDTMWYVNATLDTPPTYTRISETTTPDGSVGNEDSIMLSSLNGYMHRWYTDGSSKNFLSDINPYMNTQVDTNLMLTDTTTPMFSSYQYVNFVNEDDYHTLSFLNNSNDGVVSGQPDGGVTDTGFLEIKTYDITGSQVGSTQYLENSSTYGGETPATVNQGKYSLIHVGCGPVNLKEQTADSDVADLFDTWDDFAYYTVQLCDDNVGTNKGSKKYYFVKQNYFTGNENCNKFNQLKQSYVTTNSRTWVRLGWINTFGCWDYFNFTGRSVETLSTKRQYQNRVKGTWESSVNIPAKHRPINEVQSQETVRKHQISTGFLTAEYSRYLEKMFKSPLVQFIKRNPFYDRNHTTTVKITDVQKVHRTAFNNSVSTSYVFNIEYSYKENTVTR